MGPKTQALARALFSRDGTYARAFDNLILMLILVSVVSVGLESIPDLPNWARRALWLEEIVVVAQKRSVKDVWRHIGTLVTAIQPTECNNYFQNAGYDSIKT